MQEAGQRKLLFEIIELLEGAERRAGAGTGTVAEAGAEVGAETETGTGTGAGRRAGAGKVTEAGRRLRPKQNGWG